MQVHDNTWQIWIDTGGTFTDCLAYDPNGKQHRAKVLSSGALRGTVIEAITNQKIKINKKWEVGKNFLEGFSFSLLDVEHSKLSIERFDPSSSIIELNKPLPIRIKEHCVFEAKSPEEAPILAARLVTGTPIDSPLPNMFMRLGTTRGTNALLERRGVPTALFITQGFADLLAIGNQQRPDLFALNIRKSKPLYQKVVEVPERITAKGKILSPLQLDKLAKGVDALLKSGIRVASIALMHSYLNSNHENKLAEFLYREGFDHVSCSSDLAPFIKLLPRAETAVVDAYLSPIINDYIKNVQAPIRSGSLHVMTSAGGLVQPKSYFAKDSLLSGPAAGVVGAALTGCRSGFDKVITFDMGGTSTDVARFDGNYDYVFEHEVGDAHLVAPALAVESVAAGGGSICDFDEMELRVGPESAGAQPGPACYAAKGPLTLTDVNLLLGRLDSSFFEIPLDKNAAEVELEKVQKKIQEYKNEKVSRETLLQGFLGIACQRMADAIHRISIRKGYDPKDYALVAFGGAGGQYACLLADELEMKTIIIPQDAGLLSALGLGNAKIERFAERQILKNLKDVKPDILRWIHELKKQARECLAQEGISINNIEISRTIINLRFVGQDSVLQIEHKKDKKIEELFEQKYRAIFGHWQHNRPIEIESIRVIAGSSLTDSGIQDRKNVSLFEAKAERFVKAYFDGKWQNIPAFNRENLEPGTRLTGPALIFERHCTTVVEQGWNVEVNESHAQVLKKEGTIKKKKDQVHPEVIRLELFTNRFSAIAQEMGEMLQRTAISTNVKERLDFSCAVLDREGELVVNAPHIPVHLGAMGLCVRELKNTLPMEPGDVIVTNHPRFGGSHLPDVTVVTPVFLPDGQLLGFVANRAHHAEIGGVRPGSMPHNAKSLAEEGIIISPMYLFKNGKNNWKGMFQKLNETPFPSRAIEENMADLRAAVAANRSGVSALLKLAKEHGEDTIYHYMAALKNRAESKIRGALEKIPNGKYEAIEFLDDGTPLQVKIKIIGDSAEIDFTGSGKVHAYNLNATPAIVNSVVIYVLRLLVREPLPLNEGLMRAITLNIPQGILNPEFPENPFKAPAVVGGNVETSQRLVDTMIKALGLAACSQGTMNNAVFGSDHYSYYETVCGGCGAGANFDGATAVHSHMTNTRITDPEIIEHRYPVRVERFAIRKNSGGNGKYRGGDGVVREISFLEKMSLSVLGQHRKEVPYGLKGGKPGKATKQRVVRSSGEVEELNSIDGTEVNVGDRFIVETPGGGGYGVNSKEE
jgi:5-oxoprolinase (ATP-hydrolysing)